MCPDLRREGLGRCNRRLVFPRLATGEGHVEVTAEGFEQGEVSRSDWDPRVTLGGQPCLTLSRDQKWWNIFSSLRRMHRYLSVPLHRRENPAVLPTALTLMARMN